MKLHEIEFTIKIKINPLPFDEYMELQQPFYDKILNKDMPSITFEEINKWLKLDKKKYYPTSIEFSKMNREEERISTTKIEITG